MTKTERARNIADLLRDSFHAFYGLGGKICIISIIYTEEIDLVEFTVGYEYRDSYTFCVPLSRRAYDAYKKGFSLNMNFKPNGLGNANIEEMNWLYKEFFKNMVSDIWSKMLAD